MGKYKKGAGKPKLKSDGSQQLIRCVIGKQSFVICALREVVAENCPLALVISDPVVYFAGSDTFEVHLTGSMSNLEDDDDSEGENAVPDLIPAQAAAENDGDSSDDDEDDEDEGDDSNDVESDDESSDDDEDEDEDEDEKEPEPQPAKSRKRKPEPLTVDSSANKPKKPKTPKIVKLPSGLKYRDMQVGTGAKVKKGRTVTVRYRGLLRSGIEFDSNMPRGKPFSFTLGAGEVVKGWDLGLMGMKVGGKRELVIPPHLGYGQRAVGDKIPANSTLLFEVELIKMR